MSEVRAVSAEEFKTTPKPLSDEDLVNLIDGEFEAAMGQDGGDLAKQRAKAWDYYLSQPFGDEKEGESQIVTSDVSDVIDGMMPSLLRIFTTQDNLADFEPYGSTDMEANARDEAQARQESDYVNYVFFKQNPAFMILYTWFMDGMIQKNGIVKCWWDDSKKVTRETYKGLNDVEYQALLQDEELEIIEESERQEDSIGPDNTVGPITVHDVTFRRTSERGNARVEPVPPEEYRVSSDCKWVDPNEARFVGHERNVKRSKLIKMGFDPLLVDAIPANDATDVDTPEKQARKTTTDERDTAAPHDRSQDEIKVREGYTEIDMNADGIAERWQVFTANQMLLSKTIVDRQPFHVVTPYPLPHKHFGLSVADKVMDIQEINSTLIRQTHNNLYHSNNPSHAIWEQAIGENTLDDLLTTRVGSYKRFTRPPAESYAPMVVPFTAQSSFQMIEYWAKIKQERTGVSGEGEGLTPEALKNIQQSVLMQAVDLAKMKIEAVVRVMAETGIKSLFLHIHELLQKHQDKIQVVKLRDEWVPIDPREWRTRENMTVNIGLGIGTREQNLMHLNAIGEVQEKMANTKLMGITVTPKNLYNTAVEIVRNAGLKSAEKYFTDPGDTPVPSDDDATGALAQQQAALAERQQLLQVREQNMLMERDAMRHQEAMQKTMLQFQTDTEKNRIAQEKVNNELFMALEKISTQLTEIEAKYSVDVPGSKV